MFLLRQVCLLLVLLTIFAVRNRLAPTAKDSALITRTDVSATIPSQPAK